MKLIDVYTAILEYGSMKPDSKGFIQNKKGREPILIEGKQLVLPLNEQLKNFNPDEKMIFHPMAENIFKGESEVIRLLKTRILMKVNITTSMLLQVLINILASPDLHAQMNPQQAMLFNMGMDADSKTLVNFTRLMNSALKVKDGSGFVSCYLNRGGSFEGKRVTRVSVISFPFYEQLTREKETPNAIPIDYLRVKDKDCLMKLFEFVFPELQVPEAYNYGTNNNTVPYLDALLMGTARITSRLNDLMEIYKDYIDDYEEGIFASDWVEDMQNIEALKSEILRIPVQYGSDGSLAPQAVAEQPQAPQMPVGNVPQMPVMAPMQQQRPVASTAPKGKVSFGDAIQSNGVAQSMAMQQPMGYPMQQGYPQPMQPMGYPNQYQQPTMQQLMQPMGYPMQQGYPQPMQPMGYPQQPMMYPGQMQQPMQPQVAQGQGGWPMLPAGTSVRHY